MPDRPKPLVDLRTRVRPKTIRLNDADYRAIIRHVPLKPGADMALLKAEIRTAAQWYIIGVEVRAQPATARRVRATFVDFLEKAKALLDVIKTFPPELRPRLRGSVRSDEHRKAWPSPFAIVEAELEGLIPRARKAAQGIPVKTGPKEHTLVEAKQMLARAWKNATGRSPPTDGEAFVAFEIALTSCLNKHLTKLKMATIPVPSLNQVIKAVAKK